MGNTIIYLLWIYSSLLLRQKYLIIFYVKYVVFRKHLFSLFFDTHLSPTHIYISLSHPKVRLKMICISSRKFLLFMFPLLWYLRCTIRISPPVTSRQDCLSEPPCIHSHIQHTLSGVVYVGSPGNAEAVSPVIKGLLSIDERLIHSLTITIQFDKDCAGANQRMCGDKGQGHSPRLGREPGNAQLPEKGTFK